MVAHIPTVAFEGVSVVDIDVQVQAAPGLPAFTIVGLPDKAVGESRERVRAALHALGLALPPKRITVNLAPADLLKEGGHYDLPIALGLLAVIGVVPAEEVARFIAMGELALDGSLAPVAGVLPAAIHASASERGLICPARQGPEAAWAGQGACEVEVLAAASLLQVINHFKGTQVLTPPVKPALDRRHATADPALDLADVKGQESAKRALEIAAAGGHNLLMSGPPGAGKSMLAARLADLLPPLVPAEILEVSMIQSLAGMLAGGQLTDRRPFRDPHHSASMAALVGGGHRVKPGEISLAHLGVLFLDELPEFDRRALEALRQPLETGRVSVARVNAHVTYPARVQLIAAMNPCRCGYLGDPARACVRAPKCAEGYEGRLSGPLLDRFDLHIEVPPVPPVDLGLAPPGESSAAVAARVAEARRRQQLRLQALASNAGMSPVRDNASLPDAQLSEVAEPDAEGRRLLVEACQRFGVSARGYHRVLRVARSIADLAGDDTVARPHIAEALAYRRLAPGRGGTGSGPRLQAVG
jgi:magnesium chelatase family protein